MRAHLATVDRVLGTHALLDERVAALALDRHATGGPDNIDGVPGQTRIADDRGTGLPCQQADNVIALDEITVLVEQETAIEVALPGHAEIGPRGLGRGCRRP